MTSLPIGNPAAGSSPEIAFAPGALVLGSGHGNFSGNSEDEQFLLRAFRSFAQAADSLERSYGLLRAEVERLRRELEQSNSDLARSVEENCEMRQYLDRILEGLPCGVLVVSEKAEVMRANPEALRLLGSNPANSASPPASAAIPSRIRELLEDARRSDSEQERSVPEEAGGSRWLAARHASIAGGASVFILRDVTERRRLEAAQDTMRRHEALAEMSAVLAHEIRNPLASLELFAGLLAESALDADCRAWVGHVQAGLRTLAATVNNVLHFHSVPEPEFMPVDLGRLLSWARDFFQPLGQQAHISFSLQNRLAGVWLSADRHRLEQVLLNLVLNAVRALPGGGWIELGGRESRDGKSVILTVSDTGPGIAAENLPRLFDPGFSTRAGSPGLGLAVCRKIVEQHGGTIMAGGRPGCGATFTLTFPLAGSVAPKTAQGAA